MISYLDALRIAQERAEKRFELRLAAVETRSLLCSLGQILAQPLEASESVPRFNNSAMDGFALESLLTATASEEQPVVLNIAASLVAGDAPTPIEARAAVEIMTGTPLPLGRFDAVVKLEDIKLDTVAGTIKLKQAVKAGENIRWQGTDFTEGQRLAGAGQRVSPELIMAAACLGLDRVPVHAPVRIALLTTGRELSHYANQSLDLGMIRDASGPFLSSLMQRADLELVAQKILTDDPNLFRKEVLRILELQPDIIISTGAVSMGRHDFIKSALLDLGAQIHFHKVAMRPGKPLLFAEWESGPVWFGLPGNPISTVIGWRFFVEPYLRQLRGQAQETDQPAFLQQTLHKPRGFSCFYKAFRRNVAGSMQLEILEGQASYLISPLLSANCWAIFAEETETVMAGELIRTVDLHDVVSKENPALWK